MKYIIEDIYGKDYDENTNKFIVIARLTSLDNSDRNIKKRLFYSDMEEAKKASIGTVVEID